MTDCFTFIPSRMQDWYVGVGHKNIENQLSETTGERCPRKYTYLPEYVGVQKSELSNHISSLFKWGTVKVMVIENMVYT